MCIFQPVSTQVVSIVSVTAYFRILRPYFKRKEQIIPPPPLKLTGAQQQEITDMIIEIFPEHASLNHMLQVRFNMHLQTIAPGVLAGTPYDQIVFNLIGLVMQQGWLSDFLLAVCERFPKRTDLADLALKYVLKPNTG